MRGTSLLLLLVAACTNDLPKQSIVNKLRVLAVQAEPPELVMGGSSPPAVSITALAVDLDGGWNAPHRRPAGIDPQRGNVGGRRIHGARRGRTTGRIRRGAVPNPGSAEQSQSGDAGVARRWAELPADGSGVLHAGVKVRLAPVAAPDAKEMTASGPEALNFSFFATDGDVDSLRSTDQTATGQPADPSID